MRIIPSSIGAFVLLGFVAAGCGGKDGSEVNGGNGDGKGASSSGGSLNLDPSGNGLGATNSGTVIDPDAACAKGTASANLAGVNMFVMFDRSTSMNDSAVPNGASRWQLASAALDAFFASTNAAGLNLALRFFPHDVPSAGCSQNGCDMNACAAPLVDLGVLTADAAPIDAHEKALVDATAGATPAARGGGMMGMMSGGTPISAALGGALQWASAQHTKTPNENSVVVLVTDGQPNGCDENIGNIAKLAADALANDGTRTYAIGLTGSQEADMNQIAMAGGTTKGIFVADGANTTQDLLDALAGIRGAILDCDFAMPVPKPGVAVEPAFINVNYTPSSGKTATLPQVSGEASCAATAGWYYDNPVNPSRIILCKSTCDNVTNDPMASLEILLGCPTSTDVPK
ncbi:MAG: VWA domain-containing protein [Myxococcales bacterium]